MVEDTGPNNLGRKMKHGLDAALKCIPFAALLALAFSPPRTPSQFVGFLAIILVCSIVCGAIFALCVPVQDIPPASELPLSSGETIVLSEKVARVDRETQHHGRLTLTNERLIFSPDRSLDETLAYSISRENIADAVRNGMLLFDVVATSGETASFLSYDNRGRWISKIRGKSTMLDHLE